MSGTSTANTPAPVQLPSMQAGETDSRYMDCTPDLGPVGDTFPSTAVLAVVITRQDGNAITANDLALTKTPSLDPTQLIPTFWYLAPLLSAGVWYNLVLTANTTTQGRLFKRTFTMYVSAQLG